MPPVNRGIGGRARRPCPYGYVDPTTGAITSTSGAPSTSGPSDLDFDGAHLWFSSGTGAGYQLADPGQSVLEQLAFGVSGGRDFGVAWRSGQLFVGGLFGGMELYDASTGADLGAVVHAGGAPFASDEVGPSVFVGSDLVILSNLGLDYYAPTIVAGGGG